MRTRGRSVTIAFMSENATDPVPAGSARASDAEPDARPELPAGSESMAAGSARRVGPHRPVLSGAPATRPPGGSAVGFRWYPRLARDTHGSVVGGVCSGLADHLGLKVTHVRLAMVLLASISGAGVALYSALWVLLPSAPARADAPPVDARERRRGKALVAVAVVGAVLSFMMTTATGLSVIVPVLAVALGAGLVWQQYDRGG